MDFYIGPVWRVSVHLADQDDLHFLVTAGSAAAAFEMARAELHDRGIGDDVVQQYLVGDMEKYDGVLTRSKA